MYTRYYDGYTGHGVQGLQEPAQPTPVPEEPTAEGRQKSGSALPLRLPGGLDAEDIILVAVLMLVLADSDNSDPTLPAILGLLLVGGK